MHSLTKKILSKNNEDQRGATAVEFAIVIMAFVLITFGIIEFGLLMYNQHVVTNAGREGARAGIVARSEAYRINYQEITQIVNSYGEQYIVTFGEKYWEVLISSFDTEGNLKSEDPKECEEFNEILLVNVEYNYDFLLLPFSKELSSTTKMKCE